MCGSQIHMHPVRNSGVRAAVCFAQKTGTVGSYTAVDRVTDMNAHNLPQIADVWQMGFTSHLPENEEVYAAGHQLSYLTSSSAGKPNAPARPAPRSPT